MCFLLVWVVLPNLLRQLMKTEFLELVGPRIGIPIMSDKFTYMKERWSYARLLIEVDLPKTLIKQIEVKLPKNIDHVQIIEYENLLAYYSSCKEVGHQVTSCGGLGELL
ncbi:hypothetical protein Dimus_039819 [Dionaea muscipula]